MPDTLRDLRLGWRTLRRSPGLTLVSVLALTLGIGLTTMVFSIVHGALLRGLPFHEGDRIVTVIRNNPERGSRGSLPIQDYADLAAGQRSFSHIGAFNSGTMNVSGTDRAERYSGSWVTHQTLAMTGVRPLIGRDFLPGEDAPNGAKVAVLGYDMWQTRYGGRADVLGTVIRVNGEPHEVVGVMPDGFTYPQNDQLWIPAQYDPLVGPRGSTQFVQVVGRLAPGATIESATADLTAILRRLGQDFPETNAGFTAVVQDFVEAAIGPEPRQLLWTMLGATFFVLLIACSNVANLLLDRAAHRSKEVGVRSALGATRGAIIRVFLSEALLLALLGTALGIAVAAFGIGAFNRAIAPTQPPFFIEIGLFPPVLLFAIGTALVATLFAGLLPALQASRTDIAEVLKDESRGASSLKRGRISRAIVVFEIALSCGLLVAAGLMIRSVVKAQTRDTGFHTTSVFTARVGFPAAYTDTVAQLRFFEQLDERVGALPGVTAATIASGLPGAQQGFNGSRFAVDGVSYAAETELPDTRWASVTPGFFRTLGIELRQGRLFEPGDRDGSLPVALVNERFIAQHFAGQDVLGRRIRLGGLESTAPWVTIVGVIPDLFVGDPEDPRPPVVLRPFAQSPSRFAYVTLRTGGAPMAFAEPVRLAVASLDPDIPTYWPMTLDQAIAEPLWFVRIFGTLFMVFGVAALFLASIGLYAVMAFSVSRRTREMGVRMALGASARDVVRLILGGGMRQLAVGLLIGLALAAGVSRLLSVILFDVNPRDPLVFGGVATVLLLTGTLACLLPARRASRVDPAEAMRSE
jgi:putative ABC transport system permease protein